MYYVIIHWPCMDPQFAMSEDGEAVTFDTEAEAEAYAREENFANVWEGVESRRRS